MKIFDTHFDDRTGDLRLGTAEIDDVPRWVELVHSAYRSDESHRGWTTEADLLQGQRLDPDMAMEMLEEPGFVLLAEDDRGRLVASAKLEPEPDQIAYFGLFAVSPSQQGRGIGRVIMDRALEECHRRWGSTRARMTVLRQRPDLIAYYERRGFELTGVRSPFPYGDARFGLPQVDDLEFVELMRTRSAD